MTADILARRIDVAAASRRDVDAVTPAMRAMLVRHAAGITAWIAEPRARPLGYRLLEAQPEPWQPRRPDPSAALRPR